MAQVKVNNLIDWLQRTQNGRNILEGLIKDNIENRRNIKTKNIPYDELRKQRKEAFLNLYNAYVSYHNSGRAVCDRDRRLKEVEKQYDELFFSMNSTMSTREKTYLSLLAEKDREFMDKRTHVPEIIEELLAIQSFLEMKPELSSISPRSVVEETNVVANALELINKRGAASINYKVDPRVFIGLVDRINEIPEGPFKLDDYLPTREFKVSIVDRIMGAIGSLLSRDSTQLGDQYIDVGEK